MRSSKYLSTLSAVKVDPVRFRLGNGQYLHTEKVLHFELTIQAHRFRVSPLVAEHLTGIDLILGTETLSQLGGMLDFCENKFKIQAKKVYLKSGQK